MEEERAAPLDELEAEEEIEAEDILGDAVRSQVQGHCVNTST
jgi:hypothetical protein